MSENRKKANEGKPPVTFSKERNQKISLAKKEYWENKKAQGPLKWTEEHKEKIRVSMKIYMEHKKKLTMACE